MTRDSTVGWVTMAMLAALVSGCASRTEVIVAVDSDIATIDQITITVTGPTGVVQTSNATIGAGQPSLPRTLGLTWSSGALGPYTAVATGLRAGSIIVSRSAIFSFVQGETRVVRIDLITRCQGAHCAAGMTCGEQLCRAAQLAPNELLPYTGTIDHSPDAGGPAVDMGVPPTDMGIVRDVGGGPIDMGVDMFVMPPRDMGVDMFVAPNDVGVDMGNDVGNDVGTDTGPPDAFVCPAEICNGVDDDCDGMIDEGFMLQTDPANCGMCNNVCRLANTTADTCAGGRCIIGTCNVGFLNCDGRNSTGCEVNGTNDANHCGTCGTRCMGATSICCRSACAATCP